MKKSLRKILLIGVSLVIFGALTLTSILAQPTPLDPLTIPKYVNQLTKPAVYVPTIIKDRYGKVIRHEYTVDVSEFKQQLLPPSYPMTTQFGYGGYVYVPGCPTPVFQRSVPGATFEMIKDLPAVVHWRNKITTPHFLPVDPTLDWANPNNFPKPSPPFLPFPPGYPQAQFPVPMVTHVHGIEVESTFDGQPDTWFTFDGKTGPEYVTNDYTYPNSNAAATFWYHDHSFGITRLNVIAGLTGFFLIRDPKDKIEPLLPKGDYEIPLVIVDRSFNTDGSLDYPTVGLQPDINPYWTVTSGNTNMVNGKVWPNLNVERRQYRFRLLNAANQRFYEFRLSNGMSFTQIGSDGGYLPKPAVLTSLALGPTERGDILIDFSQLAPGTKVILQNTSTITAFDPETTGQVMQFTVKNTPVCTPPALPATLNTIPTLTTNASPRYLAIQLVTIQTGGIRLLLNGQGFHAPVSELPVVGTTEDWNFVNTTGIPHDMHVHLIQYQVISRQAFDAASYIADWEALNGSTYPLDHPTIELPVEPYLMGDPVPAGPTESGWKDSVTSPPQMVTKVRIRWAPQLLPTNGEIPGQNQFPINPFVGPGYIWHCHMLDHEDNELMRPFVVVPGAATPTPTPGYPLAPGRYRIKNSYAAKYMRPYNNGTADNTKVVIYPYLSDISEQFDLEQAGDGTYYIKSAPSGKYLMNYNGGTANNTNIVIYPLNGNRPNMKFILESAGGGYYRIKHAASGKYLRVGSSATNTNVVLYTLDTSSNMKWKFESVY